MTPHETGAAMTTKQAKKLAKEKLSPRRYAHTKNVAAAARLLAQHYGVDADKAELAGWLHDIVKEYDHDALLQLLGMDAIMAKSAGTQPEAVWHGPAGAIYARHCLGITDAGVLEAIACHTTGRVGMTTLDKVLYLADVISPERDYAGVDKVRALAQTNLDAAVVATMEENVAWLEKTGKPLAAVTLDALAALKK